MNFKNQPFRTQLNTNSYQRGKRGKSDLPVFSPEKKSELSVSELVRLQKELEHMVPGIRMDFLFAFILTQGVDFVDNLKNKLVAL